MAERVGVWNVNDSKGGANLMATKKKPAEETAVAKLSAAALLREEIKSVAALIDAASTELAAAEGLEDELAGAVALQHLREGFPQELVERYLMPLQGTRLGFRTDRDNPKKGERKGYSWEDVRDRCIEARSHGASLLRNEFNIISNGVHLTREFFDRKVSEHPEVSNLHVRTGVPRPMKGDAKTCLVDVTISGELRGEPFVEKTEQAIRVNTGQMHSSSQSKARRAALREIYVSLVGGLSRLPPDGSVDDIDAVGAGRAVPALPSVRFIEPAVVKQWRDKLKQFNADEQPVLDAARALAEDPSVTWETIPLSVDKALREWSRAYTKDHGPMSDDECAELESVAQELGLSPEDLDEVIAGLNATPKGWKHPQRMMKGAIIEAMQGLATREAE